MKLGYAVPNNHGVLAVHQLVDLAVRAESLGYRSVWVSEHLFHAAYVAKRLGDRPYWDPLTVLTAAAVATQHIRLGTSVLVLPWHHPARLGKTIATLDHLSNGRMDLGVGVAVTEDEFANLGVPFGTRGAQTNDTLAALNALWYQDVPEYEGRFYQFSGQRFEPKPKQRPLPIHVGGGVTAALNRVANFGQGWHALGKSPAELADDLETLAPLMEQRGRSMDELHISIRCVVEFLDQPFERPAQERRTLRGTEEEVRQTIAAFAEAGVHEIVVDAATADVQANLDTLERVVGLVN